MNGETVPDRAGASDISGSAERMRRFRQRKRKRLRHLRIEFREREIDVLIKKGLLAGEQRDDNAAVVTALYTFLDRALGAT